MANPRYHDDPDWYERPGETVHLEVDQQPAQFTVPALPWCDPKGPWEMVAGRRVDLVEMHTPLTGRCSVCRRAIGGPGICAYCSRAQAADECAKARANIPQPSHPRIQIREAWESWSLAQADPSPTGPTIREYETRLD